MNQQAYMIGLDEIDAMLRQQGISFFGVLEPFVFIDCLTELCYNIHISIRVLPEAEHS